MPRMTTDLLVKCTGQAKRKRDESLEQFLRRITHLHCSEKGFETIEGLSVCRNLTVLYLYDNKLTCIENLSSCTSLTHLYLQNNDIASIRNLAPLYRLAKLYLNGNAITVVEGLEALNNLTELHLAYQRLPQGEKLLFDPRTIKALARTLTILNVSGNNLDSIEDLQCLTELTEFSAADNQLSSMKDLSKVLGQWSRLVRLEMTGNPLCQKYKYRDRTITMGRCIGCLDGREVSETERQFLMNWKVMRVARRRQQKADVLAEQMGSVTLANSKNDKTQTASSLKAQMPKAALPLTLPALPARQLPRRSRRIVLGYQEAEHQADYRTMLLPVYSLAQVASKDVCEGLRLPEIVTDQLPSLVAQKTSVVRDSLPMIHHQQLLSSVSHRPVHVTGPQ